MARRSNSNFFKQLDAWGRKKKEQREFIARELLLRMGNRAQTPQFGVRWTGGRYEEGKIPIDSLRMIKSFTVAINFRIVARGRDAHVKAAGIVQPSDRFQFWWATPYAKRIEFGFSGQDSLGRRYNQKGRFWATMTYNSWGSIKRQVLRDSENA